MQESSEIILFAKEPDNRTDEEKRKHRIKNVSDLVADIAEDEDFSAEDVLHIFKLGALEKYKIDRGENHENITIDEKIEALMLDDFFAEVRFYAKENGLNSHAVRRIFDHGLHQTEVKPNFSKKAIDVWEINQVSLTEIFDKKFVMIEWVCTRGEKTAFKWTMEKAAC